MEQKIRFPHPFAHKHPPIENTNKIIDSKKTLSMRMSDRYAAIVGSWKFIIIQSGILTIWAVLNLVAWFHHWDPYPFILMNLVLSLQAAYSTPIIMISQNRTAERDSIEAHHDYLINSESEE